MKQDVSVSLPNRMRHQLVANHAAVDKKILQIGLTSRERGLSNPAPQPQVTRLALNRDRVFGKFGPTNLRDTARALRLILSGRELQCLLAIVAKREGDIGSR